MQKPACVEGQEHLDVDETGLGEHLLHLLTEEGSESGHELARCVSVAFPVDVERVEIYELLVFRTLVPFPHVENDVFLSGVLAPNAHLAGVDLDLGVDEIIVVPHTDVDHSAGS